MENTALQAGRIRRLTALPAQQVPARNSQGTLGLLSFTSPVKMFSNILNGKKTTWMIPEMFGPPTLENVCVTKILPMLTKHSKSKSERER